jgi:predicted transcriptional regulator
MKTAVSIPDDVFEQADRFARETGRSRSQLYAEALRLFLQEAVGDPVTAALDRVYGEHQSDAGELGLRAGRALIESGDWEW